MEMKNPTTIGQPDKNDPQEQLIRNKLESLSNTEWSKSFFENAKVDQIAFINKGLDPNRSGLEIRNLYLDLIKKTCDAGKTKIESGLENLAALKQGPVILITNHLGTAKISRIDTKNININGLSLQEIEPFPIRIAPFYSISEKLSMSPYECAIELPNPFLDIQTKSGVISIPADGKGRTELLQNKIKDLIDREPKSLIIMYPEGGTSGKRNLGGPYDLDNFHTGAFVIAKNLKIPVLPVFQSFDPISGFELSILKPTMPSELDNLDLRIFVQDLRTKMQKFAPK